MKLHPQGVKVFNFSRYLLVHQVCQDGENYSLDVVQFLVEQYPESVNRQGRCGDIPPYLAACYSKTNIVEFLSDKGPFTVLMVDHFGRTPLQVVPDDSKPYFKYKFLGYRLGVG